jgi:hypothetical protein
VIKRKPVKRKKKPKEYKRATYVDTLDSVFSHYIRQKYADDDGMVRCYTCDITLPFHEMQCGHFYSRTALSTRWHPQNARPQEKLCNVYRHGNYPTYGTRLASEIGAGEMEKLGRLNKTIVKLSNDDLLDKIRFFYEELRWPDQISMGLLSKLRQLKVV